MDTELLTEREVSAAYSLTIPWLRRVRIERRGPPFLRLGRMVRYRRVDLERYLATRTVDTLRIG
jgi:hypothetical protein